MANLNCGKCGKATSDLATRCPHCSKAVAIRRLPAVHIPRYLSVMPYLLTAYMGFLAVPAAAGSYSKHNAAVEKRRIADERAAEDARVRAEAEQMRLRRKSRDSVLAALPSRKLRRASDTNLRQALAIASLPTGDTVNKAWVFLAQKELSRRDEIRRQNAEREEKRAQATARRQALLETRRERESRSSTPSGASAKCRDGSYSYSASRRGTCSRHGGVAAWY